MLRSKVVVAWLIGLACWASALAQGVPEGRVALVIGNSSYRQSPLSNPQADARLMERVLREAGFDVVRAENVGLREMQRLVRDLGTRMRRSGGVGLFYFAGHGVQIRGENYLVSTDSAMGNEDEVADDSISARAVLERMSASGGRVNLLILDACRNNPFGTRSRAIGGGLASMSAPAGSLVAFSTAPGEVASDGLIGTNGLYTAHLAQSIREPGLRVEEVLKRTRAAVLRDSGNRQTPWENSALLGDFYFRPPAATPAAAALASVAPAPAGPDPMLVERLFWSAISGRESKLELEEYLRVYPDGMFAPEARERLVRIDGAAAAAALAAPLTAPGSRFQSSAVAEVLAVGDRFRFRDTDPASGNASPEFDRRVTAINRDELEFDNGQLTVRRIGSSARNNGRPELFEDANERRNGGSWTGAFVPGGWRGERAPVVFTYVDQQVRELGGRTWTLVRASIEGTMPRAGFFSRPMPIRGHALIDEATGTIVEFELRSDNPIYSVRREWVSFVRGRDAGTASSPPPAWPATNPEPRPMSKELNIGDRLRFRDVDPATGTPLADFSRTVTRNVSDALDFDAGQLTIRPVATSVSRAGQIGELIESNNHRFDRQSPWGGMFYPASPQFEGVPVTFKFERYERRILNGVEWYLARVAVTSVTPQVAVAGGSAASPVSVRGQALVSEDMGLFVEFDLRSDHPQYALRRQWVDVVKASR